MFGARINGVQTAICNVFAYLLSLPDEKPTTVVVKRDKTSRLDRNNHKKCSRLQRTLLIRKKSIKYCLFLLWIMVCFTCLTLYYVSHDVVYKISLCMCVKQQTDDLYIIHIVVIDSGWNF